LRESLSLVGSSFSVAVLKGGKLRRPKWPNGSRRNFRFMGSNSKIGCL
jgi:hypothetical protein